VITPFRRSLIVILALLFGLAIAVLSVVPINRYDVGTRARYAAPAEVVKQAARRHAVVHIVIFGVAGAVAWCVAEFAARSAIFKIIALLMALLLGWGTEYLQHTMYHNVLEITDIQVNLLSVLAGFMILTACARVRAWGRMESCRPIVNRP
jgi:hypothetical protein